MIPHYIISVDNIPLTGTGKVNSKLFPAPQSSDLLSKAASPQQQQDHHGHEDHNEKPDAAVPDDIFPLAREIAAIFTEVLGRSCSVYDDFFFSGGHSILAARAVQTLRNRLSGGRLAVPFTTILAHPTPVALAVRLDDMRRWKNQADDLPEPLVLLRPSTDSAASLGQEGNLKKQSEMTDIVVMHPIGGGLMPMAGLVDTLGARLERAVRIAGLPWSGTSSELSELATTENYKEERAPSPFPPTVEALAARYANILMDFITVRRRESRDSKCPLYLLGWSFGGTLAYETAKRAQSMMMDQGQEEKASFQVILLDAPTLDAAVREIDPCSLVAENYAEHFIEYVSERARSTTSNALSKNKSTTRNQTLHHQIQSLTQLFRASGVDEHTNLTALSPLVRKCYDNTRGIPSWIADADLVESARGLQANLQALCGSSYRKQQAGDFRKKNNDTTTITLRSDDRKLGVIQVQASRGLGTRLPDPDLGWETEIQLQEGRLDWTRHVVDAGHDDVLVSSAVVDLIAEHIASLGLAKV